MTVGAKRMKTSIDWTTGVLRQHLAIVGKTGSGKTYAAKGLVEGLLDAGRRVCVLDPTGAWWGLRSSADGRKPGYAVTVFGGEHADVQLTERAGFALGELLGREHLPAIVDLSDLLLSERHRFVERFAEAIFRTNKAPLHLVVDEADEFAPQSPLPDTKRMLGAIDRIVRRGRIKGFRVVLISQRPAVINKNVLTQANAMIAMRLPSPQDRKAIEAWVQGQADADKGREVLSTLARLRRGEGWVWAPELDVLERTVFPPIRTFDSSRTPEDGEAPRAPTAVADVDLSAVRAAMEEAIEEAQANDPDLLRRRIKDLEGRLAASPGHDPAEVERMVQAGVRRALLALAGKARELAKTAAFAAGAAKGLQKHADDLRDGLAEFAADAEAGPRLTEGSTPGVVYKFSPPPTPAAETAPPRRRGGERAAPATTGLTGPQQRVLDAIAWWASVGCPSPTQAQVGFVAGIKPGGGHFNNTVGPLVTRRLIARDAGDITLTAEGVRMANRPEAPASLEAYHALMLTTLRTGPQRRVLQAVINHGGLSAPFAAIQETTGIKPGGGHWNNTVGPLVTLGLVRRESTSLRPTALLYPDALTGRARRREVH